MDREKHVIHQHKIGSTISDISINKTGDYIVVQCEEEQDLIVFRCHNNGELIQVGTLDDTCASSSGWMPEFAFHPNEPLLAVVGKDRQISIWNVETQSCIIKFGDIKEKGGRDEYGYWGVVFSQDGDYLETHNLALENGKRFEWKSGRLVGDRWGPGGIIHRSPDDNIICVSNITDCTTNAYFGEWEKDNTTFLWYQPEILIGFPISRIGFGCGLVCFFGGISRHTIQVHKFPSCTFMYTLKLDLLNEEDEEVYGLGCAFEVTNNGSRIYAPTTSGKIIEFEAEDGTEKRRWLAHQGLVMSLRLHPTQPWIISGGIDGTIAFSKIETENVDIVNRTEQKKISEEFEAFRVSPRDVLREKKVIFEPK